MALKRTEGRFVPQKGDNELALYVDIDGTLKVKDSEGKSILLQDLLNLPSGGNDEYIAVFTDIPEVGALTFSVFKDTLGVDITWAKATGVISGTIVGSGDVTNDYALFAPNATSGSTNIIVATVGLDKSGDTVFNIRCIDRELGAQVDQFNVPFPVLIVKNPNASEGGGEPEPLP